MEKGKLFTTTIGGRSVTVETSKYAEQANGHCIVACGDTSVMVNVTMSKTARVGLDFFPLSCDFEEKLYAVGRIPGSFKRREGRGSDKAILNSRLIDRPLRPLFNKAMRNDVCVTATALSIEADIPPETYAMIGSSIALAISDIPWAGPTGSVTVGLVDGEYIINPNCDQRAKSKMQVYVAGTKDAIMMVEAGAQFVTEQEMLDGIMFAHEEIKTICTFIETIVSEVGKKKLVIEYAQIAEDMKTAVKAYASPILDEALNHYVRAERQSAEDAANENVKNHFADIYPNATADIEEILYYQTKEKVRAKILDSDIRPDGRSQDDIRPIWCEVGVLPRVHGSAVFTRGQTQALSTCTLGMIRDQQKLDGLDDEESKRYMHHYNFPGYSTGEAKPLRAPGRREIGHGALAERALDPVIPPMEDFPYAIRTVSEILSSNGSSSQASVCGSCMALMDAGVPLKAPVAGIAMGLIKDDASNRIAVLTDIQGLEDFLGDMDFKVAGTLDGITAIQMDIKIKGIDKNILAEALERARKGRLNILSKMLEVIPAYRPQLSKWAPKIITVQIDPEKIGEVIGKGGKVINKIVEETGVKMDIDDNGLVMISCVDLEAGELAKAQVLSIVTVPEPGMQYRCQVVRVMDTLGAFAELSPGKDGMIHISKMSKQRVEKVSDVLNVGDTVIVEVIKVDDRGRIDLKLISKE